MISALLEAAVRGGTLLALVWVLIKALRVRDPEVEKNIWTVIVAAALVMPVLSSLAGLVAPPFRLVSATLLSPGAAVSTSVITGTPSGALASRLELLVAPIYGVVTTVLLVKFGVGLFIGLRLRRRAFAVRGRHEGSVDVRVSAAIRSPASFASTVLLPPAYETWDSATLATVLAHEQAHVRNLDSYRLWLAALYRALFWFDPLAHWLHWRLRDLSELTSDEAAAAVAGDRATYAATLKRMASPRHLIPSTLAMADSSSLGRRVRRLLGEQGFALRLARPWRALLMSAVLVLVVLAAVPWAGAVVPGGQQAATLEFHLADDHNNPVLAQQSGQVPTGDKLYKDRDGRLILLKRDIVATSDEITRATVETTQDGPIVNIHLNARGAASMLSTTRQNIGNRLAAVYNGQVINDAFIRGAFGGEFQVTGLTVVEAHSLAAQFDAAIK